MSKKPLLLYFVARSIILPFYVLLIKTKIEGEHFIPKKGPLILASNHISFIDPLALGYLGRRRKRQIHFLAKDSMFKNPILRWFFLSCGQIPVQRNTEKAADALIHAEQALRAGQVVGIYPESTMPDDLVQLPIKSGTIRLSQKTGAPIVVVGTWGAQETWRKGRKPKPRFRRPHMMVVLPPYVVDPAEELEQARTFLANRMLESTKTAKMKLGYDI